MSSTDFSKTQHLALKTSGELQRVPLEEGTLLIGASSHCKVQLTGEGIRSLHCVVVKKDDRIDLRDWNTGCTSVNGELITCSMPLENGDQIKIAEHEITVVLPSDEDHGQPETQLPIEEPGRPLEEPSEPPTAIEPPSPASNPDSAPAIPVEIVVALKNQVEVLLMELQASQREIAALKANAAANHISQNTLETPAEPVLQQVASVHEQATIDSLNAAPTLA